MRNLCNNETHYFVFRAWLNYIAYPCSNFKFSVLFTTASPWLFFFSLTLSFKQRYLLLLKKLHRIIFLKQCFLQFSNFHQESFILVGQPLYFFVFVHLLKMIGLSRLLLSKESTTYSSKYCVLFFLIMWSFKSFSLYFWICFLTAS